MKNVTGTSKAVAIVAVNPGTAPTKSPKSDARTITIRLYGSSTRAKACNQASLIAISRRAARSPCELAQHTPWQRHLEQLVKAEMNDHGDNERERKNPSRPDTENSEQRRKINHPGRNEPDRVDQEDVKDI